MSTTGTAQFYADLPLVEDFFDASNEDNYHPLPDNWYVAVTDIADSTSAIDQGRYKTVNLLGASPIVGILNMADRSEIPYVFGGDGSVFCIPPHLYNGAQKVLGAAQTIGRAEYGLDLRAALIPVSFIRKSGFDLRVARYAASEVYVQAIFSGGGVTYAEDVLKSPDNDQFRIAALEDAESVDFTGLECRWQEVKQRDKEVVTLLVKTNPRIEKPAKIYQLVLQEMRDIFGFDDKTNPLVTSELAMNWSLSALWDEAKFRTFGKRWFKRLAYLLKMQWQIAVGKVLMAVRYETSSTDWSRYKSDMSLNSDHRKFDDMLRVVISGSKSQRQQLQEFLQGQFKEGNLAFGIHITDAAMITCMVFQYHREHVHFVDGKDGGYVEASKNLKRQLKSFAT